MIQRLAYQLKSIGRDKLCILTFLLPILVGFAVQFLPDGDFRELAGLSFGCVEEELPEETAAWLQGIGSLREYQTAEELEAAVKDPATQMIGVRASETGIRALLSGDELALYQTAGRTLAWLYENRKEGSPVKKTVIPVSAENEGMKSLLIVIILMTAMFMGCTFNAMNMIGEKEDGIALVNQILPMTARTYIMQKLSLGFIGGCVSAGITALVCIRIGIRQILPFMVLLILSVYIAALTGLFVGRFSSGLMNGIVYIKIIMILFLAPPVVFYLLAPADSIFYPLSYLCPSSASFYGMMGLLNAQEENLLLNSAVLAVHAAVWSGLYFLLRRSRIFRKEN